MFVKAVEFLKSPKQFLHQMVENLGYDTCHQTTEYDASKCFQDCIKLEHSRFAKNCTKNGGLYKCCIRWFYFGYYSLNITIIFSDETNIIAMNVASVVPCQSVLHIMEHIT